MHPHLKWITSESDIIVHWLINRNKIDCSVVLLSSVTKRQQKNLDEGMLANSSRGDQDGLFVVSTCEKNAQVLCEMSIPT